MTRRQSALAIVMTALMVASVFAMPVSAQPSTSASASNSGPVNPGDTVTVTVEVTNNGDAAAGGSVELTNLPSNFSVQDTNGDGSPDILKPLGFGNPLPGSDGETYTFQIDVGSDVAPGSYDITADVQLSDSAGDSTDSTTTTVTVESSDGGNQNPQPPAGDQRGSAGSYDIASSGEDAGDVGPGATVFQGEEDIRFVDAAGNEIPAESYQQTGDGSEVLETPIPTDQPTGTYESTAGTGGPHTVTVQTPRVTMLEVTNQNGNDIAGGQVNIGDNTQLTIDTEYNFEESEPLDITIEDESGLEVTNEVLEESGTQITDNGEVQVGLNEAALDNEEYTITVEGDEDFDFGEASQSTTVTVTTGENVAVDVEPSEVTRGENARFEVDQSNEGDTHVVSIDADEIDRTPESVFRNAGDTLATTSTDDGDAIALVEIDDGVAVGSIDSSYLDTADVTVDVYGSDLADTESELQAISTLSGLNSIDDDSFTVNEGGVQLDNPQGSYVVGSEVTVNGTTTPGVDDVALYARDENDFEYLMTISVDGDDTFEEEDVVLSDPSEGDVANDTLGIPGSYRLAAVDADDSALSANYRSDQNTSAISEAVGSQSGIRVTDTALSVDYVSIINGQVAEDDDLTINGTAPGQDEVSVSFYGPRGEYDRTTINVDSDDEFESENVDVGDNLGPQLGIDTSLTQGNVVMSVFSDGRDNKVGNGQLDGYNEGSKAANFAAFWTDLNTNSNTQQQVIDTVASETTEDTGSDDLSQVFQFRYTDGRVSVDSVTGEAGQAFTVETNDTMTVSGVTNRQPDDNTITVEVIEGPSASAFDIESTENWGTDGQWSVEIPTDGVEPGNYTVEASVGGNTDIRSFQVTSEQFTEPEPTPDQNETATEPSPEPEPTKTEMEPEPTTEQTEQQQTEQQTETAETTTETGPGFTAVLALVALVAAALLAVRRRD